MKYIRTKDGIMKIDCKIETELPLTIGVHTKECEVEEYQGVEVVKQADTIEELCDKYYGVDENGTVCRVYNWSKDAYPPKPHEWAVDGFCTKEDITISELKNRFPKGIFGAVVWFDNKGNLHIDIVAKMNDKGELELL